MSLTLRMLKVKRLGATEEFARFIVETDFDAVPRKVIAYSKDLLLDCVGCALAGSLEPIGKIVTGYARDTGGVPESGIIGGGFRTSAPDAALVNGTLCHSMDYDDGGYHGHPSGTVVPVLLALGEKLKTSGREIMEAHAVGFEVYGKIAENCKELYAGGWHPTAIFGVMGAVATASKMLKLDVDQTRSAFGIAASHVSGTKANFGTMTKPMHSGNAARTGVVSAMLASAGFTGRKDIMSTLRALPPYLSGQAITTSRRWWGPWAGPSAWNTGRRPSKSIPPEGATSAP